MDQDAIQSFLCWRTQTFGIYTVLLCCSFGTVDVFIARRDFTLEWLLTQTNKKKKKKTAFGEEKGIFHKSVHTYEQIHIYLGKSP